MPKVQDSHANFNMSLPFMPKMSHWSPMLALQLSAKVSLNISGLIKVAGQAEAETYSELFNYACSLCPHPTCTDPRPVPVCTIDQQVSYLAQNARYPV